ncbi:MAG TPA: SGNH/GDSL hydrolase family protein [Candidatus Blautia pullicola]|uniref:SGNH/GDSL hydrolase family protein n=1 Tax=Candidatus Blautia pullicola TaxID=2838498 RepID=A0A9D2JSL0_9FIRM|nr:SGNH/GDSL hydrolase family protein [Candidatus Blautia pullicola]
MKAKKFPKWIAPVALFLAVMLVILFFLQKLLMPKYMSDIVEGALTEEYYQETTDHDVVFVGDCEVYENFSPIELYRDYGITSYIRGSAQQLVWQSYYMLEDTLRYETPKVAVFNVLALKYDEPQSEAYNRMTIDGMKLSGSKLGAIEASMTEEENLLDYLFPILRYHSRWSDLSWEDVKYMFHKDKISHNGYYMRVDVRPVDGFPEPDILADYTLGSNAMKYLDMMRKLCEENGVELVLVKSPSLYPHWYEEWDEQIVDYAQKYGLDYFNYEKLADDIGIDYNTDTYDAGLHLNLDGAEKLSKYFGAYLKENYDLEDHREDPEYAQVYQEKIRFYEDMKEAQYKELEEYGEIVSY